MKSLATKTITGLVVLFLCFAAFMYAVDGIDAHAGNTTQEQTLNFLLGEKEELLFKLARLRHEQSDRKAEFNAAQTALDAVNAEVDTVRVQIKDKEQEILEIVDPSEARKQERLEELSFQ